MATMIPASQSVVGYVSGACTNKGIYGGAGGGAGGGCVSPIAQNEELGGFTNNIEGGQYDNQKYLATKFVADSSYTVCNVDLWMSTINDLSSDVRTIQVAIFTDDAGEPGTQIGTASDLKDLKDVTGGASTLYNFTGVEALVESGQTYWVVLITSAAGSATTTFFWNGTNTGVTEVVMKDADGVGPWIALGTTYSGKYTLYGE